MSKLVVGSGAPEHHSRAQRIIELRTLCAKAVDAYDVSTDAARPQIALVIARLQDEIALTIRKNLIRVREDSPLSWVDRWAPKDTSRRLRTG